MSNTTTQQASAEPAPTPDSPDSRIDEGSSELLEDLPKKAEEFWEYLQIYFRARWDRHRASLRDALAGLGIWFLLILLASGALLIAVVFVFYGTALALGQWLGRPWAGYLLTGGCLLLLAVLLTRWKLALLRRESFREEIRKYEQAIRNQNEKFGTNIMERAAAEHRDGTS